MKFLTAVKSLTSCFVPSAVKRSQESGQSQEQLDPLNSLPPLKPLDLPKILLEHQFALADQGWTTVTYDTPSDSLYDSSQALLQASKAFFDLPQSYKEGFKTQIGTEEGWNRVEGEKEFITLRSLDSTPAELKDAASAYWAEAGGLLNQLLGCIARSLDLPAEALTVYSEPCARLQSEKTATMLRLFRYEGFEDNNPKLLRKHIKILVYSALSLATHLVSKSGIGTIEVGSRLSEAMNVLPGVSLSDGNLKGFRIADTMLVVTLFDPTPIPPTRDLFKSESRKYRYSIVFVLRAHSPVMVNTDDLTTPITGQFQAPIRDVAARELFRNIQKAHFNINTNLEERNEQRQKLAGKGRHDSNPYGIDDHNEKNDR